MTDRTAVGLVSLWKRPLLGTLLLAACGAPAPADATRVRLVEPRPFRYERAIPLTNVLPGDMSALMATYPAPTTATVRSRAPRPRSPLFDSSLARRNFAVVEPTTEAPRFVPGVAAPLPAHESSQASESPDVMPRSGMPTGDGQVGMDRAAVEVGPALLPAESSDGDPQGTTHAPLAQSGAEPSVAAPPASASPEPLSWDVVGEAETLVPPARLRSPQMAAVANQVEERVRRGFDLARRGAALSARAEFIQALRQLAQALDVSSETTRHSDALAAGLRALAEAEDFIPPGSRLEADLDVLAIAAGHRTPVLHDAGPQRVMALVALQRYYTFARVELTDAAGNEPVGSLALHGLGKTHGMAALHSAPVFAAAEAKAVVFHHAAYAADSTNFMSANDLAVLLARQGEFATARELLKESLLLSRQPTTWRNLAMVHRSLGETTLARLAEKESNLALRTVPGAKTSDSTVVASATVGVQWVDSQTFAASSRPSTDFSQQHPSALSAAPGTEPAGRTMKQPPAPVPAPAVEKSSSRWWPWGK